MGADAHLLSGLVLAAGRGSRYGMPKILAHDGAWLRAATEALRAAGCTDIVVATGAAEPPHQPDPHWRSITVPDWEIGLSRSVAAGLRATTGDLLITLVDTPDISGACARRVLSTGRSAAAGVARAVFNGTPGHPVFLAARHRARVLDSLDRAAPADSDSGLWFHLPPKLSHNAGFADCSDIATGIDVDRRDG